MSDRQTGRTTKQMQDAPRGAIYIWPHRSTLYYPTMIAERICRLDLRIKPQAWLLSCDSGDFVWAGGLVLDHACLLTDREREGFDVLKERIESGYYRHPAPTRVETGLCDDNGKMICVGDRVRKMVDNNTEFHGDWAIYEVRLRGIVPILSYVISERGQKLQVGYVASPLSDEYDRKLFLFASDLSDLRPKESLVIEEAPPC